MASVEAADSAAQFQLAELREKAKLLYQQGRLAESLDVHESALRLAPGVVLIHLSAARIAHRLELQEVSLRHFEEAARVDSLCYPAIEAARRICVGAGLADRAAHYSKLAYALNPITDALLSLKLTVPAIGDSIEAIQKTRADYGRGIAELLARPPRYQSVEEAVGVSAFFLAYHGENDRDLQMDTARLYAQAIPNLHYTARHCLETRRSDGRIRIGFISRFFSAHSIFATSIGLVEKLPREKFEVIVLRITPSRDDECTARMRAAADQTVDLDADMYCAREQIASLTLDILFFQDIGMEPLSYFLAFARLAPVQCVSFGHPNTTGIPTVDYFISNDLFEPPGASLHYSEKLVQLRNLPTLAYYYKPLLPAEMASKEDFGFLPEATLYVCPQTLYKIHPDFDAVMEGILARDPLALIVLIAGQFEEFTTRLRQRFAKTLPESSRRIIFLPFMNLPRFLQLLCLADVILDSMHFNGMNSSLQAFAVGTPVVTLPGRFQRGRHTQAMYRKMEILDCIAANPLHYIDIAVRIGTDRVYALSLRERIRFRNHVLFEDERVVVQFARFFESARGVSSPADFDRASSSNLALAVAHFDRGRAFASLGRAAEALAALRSARGLDPDNPAIPVEEGHVLIRLNRFEEAEQCFRAAAMVDPKHARGLQGLAQCLAVLGRAPEAVSAYSRLLEVAPDADYMLGERFHLQMHCCDWRDFEARRGDIAARVRRGERADNPGSFMTHSESPADQLLCAQIFADDFCAAAKPAFPVRARRSKGRIRVAYLSADFHGHATAYLTAGLFESHDRSKFETYGISFGPDDDSDIRRRLTGAFEHFDDVRPLTDRQIAERLYEYDIDIAVDLKGHTLGGRPRIFAFRPAPVQLSFLGYPGTLGASFMDYIVADRTLIEDGDRIHYAERIIQMPGCYQVNDSRRAANPLPTRAAAQLPESAFVFCCFNSAYKITPDAFDDWMEILKRSWQCVMATRREFLGDAESASRSFGPQRRP